MSSPLYTIASAYLAWVGLVGVRWYVQARAIATGRSGWPIWGLSVATGLYPYGVALALANTLVPEDYSSSFDPRDALLILGAMMAPVLLVGGLADAGLKRVMMRRFADAGDMPYLKIGAATILGRVLVQWILRTLAVLAIHEVFWDRVGMFSISYLAAFVLASALGGRFSARLMGVTPNEAVAMEESPLRSEIDAIQRAFFRHPRPVVYRGMKRSETAGSESVLLASAYVEMLRRGIRRRVALSAALVKNLEPAELTVLVAVGLAIRNFPVGFARSRPIVIVTAIAANAALLYFCVDYIFRHFVAQWGWQYYFDAFVGAQVAAFLVLILCFSVARARRALDHAFAAWRDADPAAARTIHDFLRTLITLHHRGTGLEVSRVTESIRNNPRVRAFLGRAHLDPDVVLRGIAAGAAAFAAAGSPTSRNSAPAMGDAPAGELRGTSGPDPA